MYARTPSLGPTGTVKINSWMLPSRSFRSCCCSSLRFRPGFRFVMFFLSICSSRCLFYHLPFICSPPLCTVGLGSRLSHVRSPSRLLMSVFSEFLVPLSPGIDFSVPSVLCIIFLSLTHLSHLLVRSGLASRGVLVSYFPNLGAHSTLPPVHNFGSSVVA